MSEIEDLLRRCRPADPSRALEARIFGGPRAWPWAVAATALLALTLVLLAASQAHVDVFDQHMGGDVLPLTPADTNVAGARP